MSVITIVSLRVEVDLEVLIIVPLPKSVKNSVLLDVLDVVDVPVSLDVPFAYNVAVLLTVLFDVSNTVDVVLLVAVVVPKVVK